MNAVEADESAAFVIAPMRAGRKSIIIENATDRTLYVKFGAACTANDRSFKLDAAMTYEMPGGFEYSGLITGLVSDVPTGQVNVTDLEG